MMDCVLAAWRIFWAVLAILLFVAVVHDAKAADDPTPEEMASIAVLAKWASHLSGLHPGESIPVAKMDNAELCRLMKRPPGCSVVALYYPGVGVAYDRTLDLANTRAAAKLVHEFVHALQYAAGEWAEIMTCAQARQLELRAYAVEAEYLAVYGLPATPMAAFLRCPAVIEHKT